MALLRGDLLVLESWGLPLLEDDILGYDVNINLVFKRRDSSANVPCKDDAVGRREGAVLAHDVLGGDVGG